MSEKLSGSVVERLSLLFKGDDHFLWYLTEEQKRARRLYGGSGGNAIVPVSRSLLVDGWAGIALRMQTELEVFVKSRGTEAGLQLYENMPLIEPLEYREVKRIREFVVAIDTSGSTAGELVQLFVQKTYNILKSTESFFTRINLHIIQCDTVIQEDAKITTQEEFDNRQ